MRFIPSAALAAFALFSPALQTPPATWFVANNGLDTTICGAATSPCRSIGQAILRASAGDTIIVAPGRYGELTDNFNFLAPGEEAGGPACASRGVICVDKRVTIESTHGADSTILERIGVELLADGIVFGRKGKGFTLNNGGAGLTTAAGSTNIIVSGNRFPGPSGFVRVDGIGHTFSHNRVDRIQLSLFGEGHSISDNVIVGSGGGAISVASGVQHVISNNLATHSAAGVYLAASAAATIRGNTLVGNSYGLDIDAGATASIAGNNLFANGTNDSPLNCGILNRSGTSIDARNNYWGAPTGPGSDPADQVCDDPGSLTMVEPFATQQFAVLPSGGGSPTNASPVCSAAQAAPGLLWPPNGQFVRVGIVGVGDADNDPVSIQVTSVTQDEPVSASRGDLGPDAVMLGSSADIRAQRLAPGNGRVYRLQFTASDGNGGTCSGSVSVGVPSSQRPGEIPVDDGQNHSSTGASLSQ